MIRPEDEFVPAGTEATTLWLFTYPKHPDGTPRFDCGPCDFCNILPEHITRIECTDADKPDAPVQTRFFVNDPTKSSTIYHSPETLDQIIAMAPHTAVRLRALYDNRDQVTRETSPAPLRPLQQQGKVIQLRARLHNLWVRKPS